MKLTLFESVQKAYTTKEQIIDTNWDSIAKFLTTWHYCSNKEDMQLFNLWEFNPEGELGRKQKYENGAATGEYSLLPDTIRRCKANATGVWGIVLDYDGQKTTAEVNRELVGWEYCLYTTFRHTEKLQKFRVVLPFKQAATPEQFKRKKDSLSKTFPFVDHASFSESQCFYLHSSNELIKSKAGIFKGAFLDLDLFDDEPEVIRPDIVKTEFTGDKNYYKEKLIESLATCSGLHYANEVSKYGVLVLVALCKSAGMSYDEYNMICWNMAAPDSSLQDESYRKSAWNGWGTGTGITTKVREEFISAYGGTSKFNKLISQARTNKKTSKINKTITHI